MPKSLASWLIPKLRNISRWWPGKQIARDAAARKVQIGFYQNGKPKYKTLFECAECIRQNVDNPLHERENTHMDHIVAVVDTKGFEDWNTYIESLFCGPENFQCICIEHHKIKSKNEEKERQEHRKKKK